MGIIRCILDNVRSLYYDGRTFGQKRRFLEKYYPGLCRHLYEDKYENVDG